MNRGVQRTIVLQLDHAVEENAASRGTRCRHHGHRYHIRPGPCVTELGPRHCHIHVRDCEGPIEGAVHPRDNHQIIQAQSVRHRGRQRRHVRSHHRVRILTEHLVDHPHAETRAAEAAAHQEAAARDGRGERRHAHHTIVGTTPHFVPERGVERACVIEFRQTVDRCASQCNKSSRAYGRTGHIRRRLVVGQGVATRGLELEGPVKSQISQAHCYKVVEGKSMVPRCGQRDQVPRQRPVRHRHPEGRPGEITTHDVAARSVRRTIRNHDAHQRVGPGLRIERGVQTAIRIEPRDAVDVRTIDRRKVTADDELVVALHEQRADLRVRPDRAVEERAVQRAIRVEPDDVLPEADREITSHYHLAIGLHADCEHCHAHHRRRDKRSVQRTRGQQPRQADAGRAVHVGKGPADDDLPDVRCQQRVQVRIHHHCVHGVIRAQQSIEESGVQSSIRVQASQPVAAHAIEGRELAADDHLPVGLHRRSQHHIVHSRPERVARVDATAAGVVVNDAHRRRVRPRDIRDDV